MYLRVPPLEAQKLVGRKSYAGLYGGDHDLQEENLRHLEDAAEMYDELAKRENWIRVECFDAVVARDKPAGCDCGGNFGGSGSRSWR